MKIDWYQTIPELGIKGRFNTPEEFDKIGLPKDLTGKTLLDIGCNSGAFLLEALNRNAKEAYGIEKDSDWRIIGRGVLSSKYKTKPIWAIDDIRPEINDMEYDVTLLLSVLHLVPNPQQILDHSVEWTGELLIVEINDRLQKIPVKLPKEAKFYGKNKDSRSVYHITKNNG